ncbi:hypothetical protein GZ212_15250 [Mangrovimonas sp. CR14]|uniref:hypothetical protein n=1 Tax=Mangrovimonas sp. CR14 TaxID=2706120 RepID=UPI001421B01A|nr:hypothetical protein [Mangrovimonas sp. CR14]NIK93516.1 hypothetical protein [Mangrovimonas sp. CR14]
MIKTVNQTIIDQIIQGNSSERAYFGFFQYGGGMDESCIKANKEGLFLYAASLIEAGLAIEERGFIENSTQTFGLSADFISENSDFDFPFIELINKPRLEMEPFQEYKQSWKVKLMGYVFGGILLFILLLTLIGFITFLKWIF